MTEFLVFMPLQGIARGNSWLGGSFFEGLQNYMENKNKGNENKIIFGDFQCTMDKMERNDENKADFRYAVSIMPWQNSLWIMNSMIYGEGRTQISLSSSVTIDLLAQDTG